MTMRITIVQAEIEQAIKAFVLSQLSVAPGQTLTVEFKNTRGEDGATADINITNDAQTGAVIPATPIKRATPVLTTKPTQSVKEEQQSVSEEVRVETPVQEENASEEAPVAEEQQVEVPAPESPVEDAPKSTGSLFASLKRPVNS
ncbi:hypothetical protein Ab1vBOLIVR2_gp81 [Agrobacterium phage OLIVR2]|uniref:Uncharacterized protein n=1 Tax=Agrobacterium phage OLIVR1 TaxID=2723769 RepID=A0A858MR74_9CAUD|nr:hypothetical protein [Xanthomonas campestris]YP_010107116.1 hypothetical protein KNU98_gp027 [Agrobacterium phage OLIVR1]QIW87384.1 hypothetical protein Ab1vBOLIVR2_gp81 [Agrobacterium phage OLIVR2]QIW87491.1 hypothetical protein Ab1vBOLIVR3_gp81 [Agrobacterium phage OLIVR3]MCF8861661.1 hypothetical protein [Xanthomonas campestris pv. campestris]QIW87277.1 hypothetical protein Ab1vBOLIVR1_gp82 [Agrobacterium phage OLIVR1]